MAKKRITVTQEDIEEGDQSNPYRCPIALAAKRFCGGRVEVLNTCLRLNIHRARSPEIALPKRAQDFIETFDTRGGRKKVKPFSFYVEVRGM